MDKELRLLLESVVAEMRDAGYMVKGTGYRIGGEAVLEWAAKLDLALKGAVDIVPENEFEIDRDPAIFVAQAEAAYQLAFEITVKSPAGADGELVDVELRAHRFAARLMEKYENATRMRRGNLEVIYNAAHGDWFAWLYLAPGIRERVMGPLTWLDAKRLLERKM